MTKTDLNTAPLGLDEFEGSYWRSGVQSLNVTGERPKSDYNGYLAAFDSLEACHAWIAGRKANGEIPDLYRIVSDPEPKPLEWFIEKAKSMGCVGIRVRDVSGRVMDTILVER